MMLELDDDDTIPTENREVLAELTATSPPSPVGGRLGRGHDAGPAPPDQRGRMGSAARHLRRRRRHGRARRRRDGGAAGHRPLLRPARARPTTTPTGGRSSTRVNTDVSDAGEHGASTASARRCWRPSSPGPIVTLVHLGDSRAYRLTHLPAAPRRPPRLDVLTNDHTVRAELLAAGLDVGEYRQRGVALHGLTSFIGLDQDALRIDVLAVPVRAGDRILLCTDGVHRQLQDDQLRDAAAARRPARPPPTASWSCGRPRRWARQRRRRSCWRSAPAGAAPMTRTVGPSHSGSRRGPGTSPAARRPCCSSRPETTAPRRLPPARSGDELQAVASATVAAGFDVARFVARLLERRPCGSWRSATSPWRPTSRRCRCSPAPGRAPGSSTRSDPPARRRRRRRRRRPRRPSDLARHGAGRRVPPRARRPAPADPAPTPAPAAVADARRLGAYQPPPPCAGASPTAADAVTDRERCSAASRRRGRSAPCRPPGAEPARTRTRPRRDAAAAGGARLLAGPPPRRAQLALDAKPCTTRQPADGRDVRVCGELLAPGRAPGRPRSPAPPRGSRSSTTAARSTSTPSCSSAATPPVTRRRRGPVWGGCAVAGEKVSRSHLEVRFQGWDVLVADCGSTNGTFIVPHPGGQVVALDRSAPARRAGARVLRSAR